MRDDYWKNESELNITFLIRMKPQECFCLFWNSIIAKQYPNDSYANLKQIKREGAICPLPCLHPLPSLNLQVPL